MEVEPVPGKKYTINPEIKKTLDFMKKKVINENNDMVVLIDGKEGSGKSTLAQQLALYCDPTFDIDRITFDAHDFKKKASAAKKGQAIVYDESITGLFTRDAMTAGNKELLKYLAQCRQQNLFIFIIIPKFFMLDFPAVDRAFCLIHVKLSERYDKGRYNVYGNERAKNLYFYGRKGYNYRVTFPNLSDAYFGDYLTVSPTEYERKKKLYLDGYNSADAELEKVRVEAKEQGKLELLKKLSYNLNTFKGMSCKIVGELLGISHSTVNKYVREYSKPESTSEDTKV